jgi:hypothetical protein
MYEFRRDGSWVHELGCEYIPQIAREVSPDHWLEHVWLGLQMILLSNAGTAHSDKSKVQRFRTQLMRAVTANIWPEMFDELDSAQAALIVVEDRVTIVRLDRNGFAFDGAWNHFRLAVEELGIAKEDLAGYDLPKEDDATAQAAPSEA